MSRKRVGDIIFWTIALAFLALVIIRSPGAIQRCEDHGGYWFKYCHGADR